MENIKGFISQLFLFSGLTEKELDDSLNSVCPEILSFQRGDRIYCKESDEKKIGFIFGGRAEVRKPKGDGGYSVLNQLSEGDSFGVLSVFSKDEFPTEIIATKNSEVLFLGADEVIRLVEENAKIAINVINFMAERISFLNKKIQTFSGTRVEDRLLSYLKSKWEAAGCKEFTLNFKKCSEAINAGRASVYRAMSSLIEDGSISYDDNKKITIIKDERN